MAPQIVAESAVTVDLLNRSAELLRLGANGELSSSWLRVFRRTQRAMESREKKHRVQQLKQEHTREEMCTRTGLDPYLELTED